MADDIPAPPPVAAPWYTSPVMVSSIVSLLSTVGAVVPKLGHVLNVWGTNGTIQVVEAGLGLIAAAAAAYATSKRAGSAVAPLTLTKKAADQVNSNGDTGKIQPSTASSDPLVPHPPESKPP